MADISKWLLDGANAIFKVFDSNGISRAEMGNLLVNGNSPAQWGFRANDASGVPIFDSLGLIAVMTTLVSANAGAWASKAPVTGTATPTGLSGTGGETAILTTSSFTLSRLTSVLLLGSVTGEVDIAAGAVSWTNVSPFYIRVSGQSNSSAVALAAAKTNGTNYPIYGSCTPWQVLSLAAGSYTAALYWNSIDGTNNILAYQAAQLTVFQLGA